MEARTGLHGGFSKTALGRVRRDFHAIRRAAKAHGGPPHNRSWLRSYRPQGTRKVVQKDKWDARVLPRRCQGPSTSAE